MTSELFTGVIERSSTGFSVFFPDVLGCASAGTTLNDACLNGEQALNAHIQMLAKGGDDLPRPSGTPIDDDIRVEAFFLARVELPGKTVRLNITMDEGLVASIDRVANNRSAFLARATREALARSR